MVFKKENRQEKVAAHWEKVNLKHKDKFGIYEDGEFVGAIGQNGRGLITQHRCRLRLVPSQSSFSSSIIRTFNVDTPHHSIIDFF
jgi:hypothetical protein